MRATGKIVGGPTQTVMRWILQMPAKFVTKKTDITTVTEVEMDEMHHFLKKTQKLWFWKTIFHRDKKTHQMGIGT